MKETIELIGTIVETTGIVVMIGGILWSVFLCFKAENRYESLRHNIGRSILLGLELMVAGDIIDTVGVKPTMDSVLLLGLIVLIRTFLSFSLEIELEGRLPWRKKN